MAMLREMGLEPQEVDQTGIFVPPRNSNNGYTKIIVSHFDLVFPFERGFAEGKTIFVEPVFAGEESDENVIYGALDNTITNAVLLNEITENGLPEDVALLFTDDEESGMWGMRNFMKIINEAGKLEEMFFINLDVTNDNWEYMTSIEYDNPNSVISRQIDEADFPAGFTRDRIADDLSAVVGFGGDGFSYCLPTREYCHTYHSNTTVGHLKEYVRGLNYLIHQLDATEREPDDIVFRGGKIA